jgi:O-antigen/teichoic acid export membrane protein
MLYKNILSGVFSKLISLVLSILFVPIFFKSLGNESYGLIGAMTMILSGLGLMDLGLGNILSKELSQRKASGSLASSHALIVSIEWLYFLIGIIILCCLVLMSFLWMPYWFTSHEFSTESISLIFVLISGVIFVQWPISLYNSGLFGLGKQVQANMYATIFSILKTVGAYGCLLIFGKTIYVFLLWMLFINALNTLVLWIQFRMALPSYSQPFAFNWHSLKEIKKMTFGFSVLGILVFVMTDVDKLIISKLLTLNAYGLYSLIFVVVTSFQLISTTLKNAFFPDIAKDVLAHRPFSKFSRFNFYTKFFNFIFIPISVYLYVFASDILLLWTGDSILSQSLQVAFRWLMLGSMFNGIMYTANNYLLAMERFTFLVKTYALSTLFFLPAVYFLTKNYGLEGACFSWFLLNGILFVLILFAMQLKYAQRLDTAWLFLLIKPLVLSLGFVGIWYGLSQWTSLSFNYFTAILSVLGLYGVVLGSDRVFIRWIAKPKFL